MEVDTGKLNLIIQKYNGDKSYILAIFQDIQMTYRFLPKEAIKYTC